MFVFVLVFFFYDAINKIHFLSFLNFNQSLIIKKNIKNTKTLTIQLSQITFQYFISFENVCLRLIIKMLIVVDVVVVCCNMSHTCYHTAVHRTIIKNLKNFVT